MADLKAANSPLKILLVMPNWLGDVIMTTPLIAYMDTVLKGVPVAERPQLYLAVRRPWASLFANDTRVSGIEIVERDGRHRGWRGLWRQGQELKAKNYDMILLGPPSLRAGLVAKFAQIPVRIGHATDGRGWLLNCSLVKGPRGSRHYAFDMLDLGLAAMDHEVMADYSVAVTRLPEEGLPQPSLKIDPSPESSTALDGRPLWVVAPGTTYGEAKTWPVSQVRDFLSLATKDARLVLLGDAQAKSFVAELRAHSELSWSHVLNEAADVTDLTGQTDLAEAASILQSASGFVGNDSGLMHLAGALGVPTVGVFGSSNPDWTHPLGTRTAAVVASGFDCQPCYRKTCPKEVFCLSTVDAESVHAKLLKLGTEAETSGVKD
ncbi:MAG: heptosyltransferase-2 [Candidatus Krumholzibacteriia bacterium]|jgi:heptosyltransferase-2